MTKIGWIGAGKLGLPCALSLAKVGHQLSIYDVSDHYIKVLEGNAKNPQEEGMQDLLDAVAPSVHPCGSVGELVERSDVVFVAVQTPHAPQFGGEKPQPEESRDFDYSFLTQAVRDVCLEAKRQQRKIVVVVVSTALPGTFNRHLRALSNSYTTLVYNPFFIAMGTTIHDFTNPEFVLVGCDVRDQIKVIPALDRVYRLVHKRPVQYMSIESAELTKVAYNTFISAKIVFANTIMEICHKTGADCDEVIDGLSLATDRVVSPKYLRGGMGDGGHCHPRDLIAMRWLAEHLTLSTDLMGYLADAREDQSQWLADLAIEAAEVTRQPIVLLGKAYKPESDLVGGSPALLLADQLSDRVHWHWDPVIDGDIATQFKPAATAEGYVLVGKRPEAVLAPAVFVVCTKHEEFRSKFDFPSGSVVIDPFGYVEDRPKVTVIRVGRKT